MLLCEVNLIEPQNAAQSNMILRRLSNKSERRYAASTLSPTACARASSGTSLGYRVHSAAQSLNVERKPCTVMSGRSIRRKVICIAILLRGVPSLLPENTKDVSLSAIRSVGHN